MCKFFKGGKECCSLYMKVCFSTLHPLHLPDEMVYFVYVHIGGVNRVKG